MNIAQQAQSVSALCGPVTVKRFDSHAALRAYVLDNYNGVDIDVPNRADPNEIEAFFNRATAAA